MLADRIAAGPIPLDEPLLIAKQITEAVEAAHELGIIHRDLKPANVQVQAETNIWALPIEDGSWRQLTDVGDQPTVIARQVAWSPDSAHVFAAVSKNIGDIVMSDGLI